MNCNTYYSSSTRLLTSRGMVKFADIKEGDFIYFIDNDGNLSRTDIFSIVKEISEDSFNTVNGKHLYIEYINDLLAYKYKTLEVLNKNNKPFNLKISHSFEDMATKEFDKENKCKYIKLNSKVYTLNNLTSLILVYLFESFYILSEGNLLQSTTIEPRLIYDILSKFYDYSGVYINMNSKEKNTIGLNTSDFVSEKYSLDNSSLTSYFLRNLNYLQDFLNVLIDIKIIREISDCKYEMYFGKYKLASDFQALTSLLGYKTFIKFNKVKNVFALVFFNLTKAITSQPKDFSVNFMIKPDVFYNVYFPNDGLVSLITQSVTKEHESCIYYAVSAINDAEDE